MDPGGGRDRGVWASERVYRALVRLFPEEVRRRYAEEMVGYFGDLCREEWHSRGAKGMVLLWASTLPDLALSVLKERGTALLLAAMAVMVTLFAAVAYAATNEVRGALLSNVENTAASRAESAAKSIRSGETLRAGDLQTLTRDGVFVIIRDGEGRVLNDTLNLTSKGGAGDSVWKKALDSGKRASGTFLLSGEYPYYIYAVPVDPPSEAGRARVVEAGKSYEPAMAVVQDVRAILAAGIGLAFLLSIAGAYLLDRSTR